jgi:4a-hydroxytetrahydrobiopterin dehydratase
MALKLILQGDTRMKLSDELIIERLKVCEGWTRDETNAKWMLRKYRFSAYMDGIAFVQQVAQWSERYNHHPMIAIDYKLVTLRLTTWSAGGLTELDFQAAAAYNEAYASMAPPR